MVQHHTALGGFQLMDGLSITALLGSLIGWLPHLASILTVIWMAIRIWETETVRRWRGVAPATKEQGES